MAYADRIQYTYDASGNRIYSSRANRNRTDSLAQDSDRLPRHHELSLHKITIHPNPTYGKLAVEITGTESLTGASITIYSPSGSIVYQDNELDVVNEIDLTQCPNGVYILIIRMANGEASNSKIIKI
jgi:hypothetical protein